MIISVFSLFAYTYFVYNVNTFHFSLLPSFVLFLIYSLQGNVFGGGKPPLSLWDLICCMCAKSKFLINIYKANRYMEIIGYIFSQRLVQFQLETFFFLPNNSYYRIKKFDHKYLQKKKIKLDFCTRCGETQAANSAFFSFIVIFCVGVAVLKCEMIKIYCVFYIRKYSKLSVHTYIISY